MQKTLIFFFFISITLIVTTVEARSYHLYGDKIQGTKFRQQIYTSPISLSKRYARLSDKEKQIVREPYVNLSESDDPPHPKKGIRTIIKPYVEKYRWYGRVTNGFLLADISIDGSATNVRSPVDQDQWLPTDVVWFMSQVISDIEFDPALCSGTPCEMTFQIELLPIINTNRDMQKH